MRSKGLRIVVMVLVAAFLCIDVASASSLSKALKGLSGGLLPGVATAKISTKKASLTATALGAALSPIAVPVGGKLAETLLQGVAKKAQPAVVCTSVGPVVAPKGVSKILEALDKKIGRKLQGQLTVVNTSLGPVLAPKAIANTVKQVANSAAPKIVATPLGPIVAPKCISNKTVKKLLDPLGLF